MTKSAKKGLDISARSFITAIAVIFVLMVLCYALTLVVPSGMYERTTDAQGNTVIDTEKGFSYTDGGIPLWKWLLSPVLVLGASGNGALIAVIAFLLVIGGVFNSLDKCGLIKYMLDRITYRYASVRYRLLFIIPLFFMVLASFPSFGLQVLFGRGPAAFLVDDFTATHRIFLYAAFIIPTIIYFALRGKDIEVKHFAMTFLSLTLLISYCTRFKYTSFLKPWYWPLHLCNTAMFIVPVCLLLKAKKLFYFTYFINVMGAFLAMIMPNYENARIFEWSLVNFWVNHYPAFFMPLLLVALRIFERPKIKQFYYSMAGFLFYFIVALLANALFTSMGHDVDFFFLNSDFIPDKFGKWAEDIFKITASLNIAGHELTFHPIFQALFFIVYVGIALGIWFVYSEFFVIADAHYEMLVRKRRIKIIMFFQYMELNHEKV